MTFAPVAAPDCRMGWKVSTTTEEEVLMPKTSSSYRVVELLPARRETHNYLDLYWWKHSIYALLEVDVTRARQAITEHKAQTGEHSRSPATWLIAWPAR
jgi:hypothetical protein